MKLSTQEEYGLRCLLRLGRQAEGESLTLAELSREEGVSLPNVAKMMRVLRKAGLVRSTRGKDGGYTLARPVEQINVGVALAVLGGRLYDPRFCDRHAGISLSCMHLTDCSIRSVWRQLQDAIDEVLGRMSLKDLLGREQDMPRAVSPRAVALPLASRLS